MGTEILGLFFLVPLIVISCNLLQLKNQERRKKAQILLWLGLSFIALFGLYGAVEGYFMQGILMGSLFYGPFYFLSWLVVTVVMRVKSSNQQF
jgi:hypothetical protein